MKSFFLLSVLYLFAAAGLASDVNETDVPKLISVTTLTRHGSRAPDKVLAHVSCKPLLLPKDLQSTKDVFVQKFGTIPGELTPFGQAQMEVVGKWVKKRYGKQGLGLVNTENFLKDTSDWSFTARAGSRQQRSMMAVSQGIFPGTSVPIGVTERSTDGVLGGPAPQCGTYTADMIVKWHAQKGKELVEAHYESAVEPFESICNVSLRSNPVNAAPGGANPHAWIGDVSDLMDSVEENYEFKDLPEFFHTKAFTLEYRDLTQLAFDLEQQSHFDDPRGAVMFAGEFPNHLLSRMESIANNQGKRPKNVAKMNMFACSRELEYGLSHLFKWEDSIQLEGEPAGRVKAGSTFVWELWQVGNEYFVDTLMFQPPGVQEDLAKYNKKPVDVVLTLQKRTPLKEYRAMFEAAIKPVGTWQRVCNVKDIKVEAHSPYYNYYLALGFVACVVLALFAYRRGFRNGYRQL